jgi:thiosulfate reductase cytochrome b subunit
VRTILLLIILAPSSLSAAGLHPAFPLLDKDEVPTRDQERVDPGATCGRCHDVPFIRAHSQHHAKDRAVSCFGCHVPGGTAEWLAARLEEGTVRAQMAAPSSTRCGACHGLVHEANKPLELPAEFGRTLAASTSAQTLRTGEIFSGQRISDSFLNLADKQDLDRPWDVHAARGLGCVSCHAAANNPARAWFSESDAPAHLRRDPRTLTPGEYILRPDHTLTAAPCTACHDPDTAHPDLPYRARHMASLACQACHVPTLHGPAVRVVDTTESAPDGPPRLEFWGVDAPSGHPNSWYTKGLEPVLLYDAEAQRFAPYTLVTRWSKEAGEDGAPRIRGVVDAVPVRHGVVEGRWVGGRCESCHGTRSRLNGEIVLVDTFPGGIAPEPSAELQALLGGRRFEVEDGRALLRGSAAPPSRYVLGMSRHWTDLVGVMFFALTLLAVTAHGLWRFLSRRRRAGASHAPRTRKEYIYNAYERLWHWVMAFSVLLLLVSGLHVHFPDGPGVFSYPTAVVVHNGMAALMLVNAFLALFYHLSTNEIRQFIPAGSGFSRRMKAQTKYYLHGIFRGAAHPAAKSRERKLNPLQQLTYAGLLNVLFPLQVGTGVLIWVAGIAPGTVGAIGGLSLITPIHNLGSWLFLSFLVAHVYLTTTGHTVLTNLRAMLVGWEDVEVPRSATPDGVDA